MDLLENQEKLGYELYDYYKKVYRYIKFIEESISIENTESIQLLAYAGMSITEWIYKKEHKYYESSITLSRSAFFLAIKNSILYYCKKIKQFQKKYNPNDLKNHILNYSEKKIKVSQANKNIYEYDKGNADIVVCLNSFYDVMQFYEELSANKEDLNALRRSRVVKNIVLIFSVLAAIITAIFTAMQFFK